MEGKKDKLLSIQSELKCNKSQYNSFGKYKYRSCEDILEAAKPLLDKYGCVLTITDDIVDVGGRVYVKATATLRAGEQCYTNSAFAREPDEKKGMDSSQITGTASSYARKYCLNGLFLIDDTKDADTDEHKLQTSGDDRLNKKELDSMRAYIKRLNKTEKSICEYYHLEKLEDMTVAQMSDFNKMIEDAKKRKEKKDE